MDISITDADAGLLLAVWARAQLKMNADGHLVWFYIILAIGDLLVDGHVELPCLINIREYDGG